jgi:hypothetical protein
MIADVVVHYTDSMAAGQSCTRQSCKQTARNNRYLLSRSPAVISRCRSWVMLLSVYVVPRATHFTGYCCWFTKVCGASVTHITGHCCWLMWGLGQHALLGIVVGFTWASGNTHYWVLLLVYVGPRATQFTGSDVGLQQWA